MTYEKFLEYLGKIDNLNKKNYSELFNIFKDKTNLFFEKYIGKLNQEEYMKNISKFEYYLNFVALHTRVDKRLLNPNIKAYLEDVSKYPLLSEIEEAKMISKIYSLKEYIALKEIDDKYLDSILVRNNYVKDIKHDLKSRLSELKYLNSLSKLSNEKDIKNFELYVEYLKLKEIFFNCNLRLVLSVLKSRKLKQCDYLDFVQWGNEGLLIAIDRFNPNYNTKFSTYAYYWINAKIGSNVFKEKRRGKASYGIQLLTSQLSNYYNQYYKEYGIYPTEDEKIRFIYKKAYPKLKDDDLDIYYEKCKSKLTRLENIIKYENACSLDIVVGEDEDNSIADLIPDLNVDIEKEATNYELAELFRNVFSKLSKKEVCILLLRNGIGLYNYLSFDEIDMVFNNLSLDKKTELWKNRRSYTLQEIGDLFNVTRQRINLSENRIKEKIKIYKHIFKGYLE